MPVETVKYVVKKNDNLWNIVKANEFPPKDWKIIYDAPYNKKFKKDHPNPDLIYKGAVLSLPRWRKNSYVHILKYLKDQKAAVGYYSKLIAKLEREVEAINKSESSAKANIKKLKGVVKELKQLAWDANSQCSGDWRECAGAGTFAHETYQEAAEVESDWKNYEKLLKAKKYDVAYTRIMWKIIKLKQEQKKAQAAVNSLKKAAASSLKNPYK